MFGNTALSFEDNLDLESVVINQENFDLNKIRECFSEPEIDWINNQAMRDKWDIHPDEE